MAIGNATTTKLSHLCSGSLMAFQHFQNGHADGGETKAEERAKCELI